MPKRGGVFQSVGALHPGKNAFDLSYEKKFTCDFGQIIPVCFQELSPGDIFKITASTVLRLQPLIRPIMHEISIFLHYFFIPIRLIWELWEQFITGGEDGNDNTPLPVWTGSTAKYSLYDYFNMGPLNYSSTDWNPLDFAIRCYNITYNEFFRDENLIDEVDLLQPNVLNRAWTKDYFTSALPFQQRGTSPSFPISGNLNMILDPNADPNLAVYYSRLRSTMDNTPTPANPGPLPIGGTPQTRYEGFDGTGSSAAGALGPGNTGPSGQYYNSGLYTGLEARSLIPWLNSNTKLDDSDLKLLADINDIRQAVQIQKWLERNARAGVRYTEFLQAHFGVSPRDERLQRPEYIGGAKTPIIVSEVLQTSSTDATTPQANLAGHGISANRTRIGSYRATEYGYILGLMSIMPRPAYQQGIPRILLRRDRYDFYFREFANLSERAIYNAEICALNNNDTYNGGVFGFQGMYDELRVNHDEVSADMRDDFDEWHLGRIFDTNNPPELNQSFIECDSQTGGSANQLKRIFAVPSERGLVVNHANHITAIRPMPIIPEPGLMDHF